MKRTGGRHREGRSGAREVLKSSLEIKSKKKGARAEAVIKRQTNGRPRDSASR